MMIKEKVFGLLNKIKGIFTQEGEYNIKLKKSTVIGFVAGFVFAAPIFIGASWLVGSSQAAVGDSLNQKLAADELTDTVEGDQASAPANIQITENDHVLGGKDAKVTLVVYSDLECSFCARHHETIKALAEKYGDKIGIAFRHFPLSFHQHANTAANAAECAGEQGKFWEYTDLAFKNQANFSDSIWAKLAGDLKLNAAKFSKCLTDKKYENKINGDVSSGSSYGVQGTPATFVNGELVSGAVPQSEFETNIDKMLQ